MRRLAFVLLGLGLIVGIVLPFFFGRAPVIVGALLIVAAGLAWRRLAFTAGALVLALLVFLAPGIVNGWVNGRGIAWEVPRGEYVLLAEAGIAVTGDNAEASTLTGRDLANGKQHWRLKLPEPTEMTGQLEVRRVGQTLIVADRNSALHAVDLRTGKERWHTSGSGDDSVLPMAANPDYVAVTRCTPCQVEVYGLADGRLRWRAPVDSSGYLLGIPEQPQQPPYDALWPASFVVVRSSGDRFAARELATGRVLERWRGHSRDFAIEGNLLLRVDGAGNLRATDVIAGRDVWTRKAVDRLNPARGRSYHGYSIALPDAGMILLSRYNSLPDVQIGDVLHLLDPRTGKVTDYPVNPPYPNVAVSSTDGPPVTAETATKGAAPQPPLLVAFNGEEGGNQILVDGHRFTPENFFDLDNIPLTPTQAAWRSDLHPWGLGTRRGVEVYDRETGKRLVRFIAEKARVSDFGERMVISEADPENPHQYVVAP